jgi:hypothetical protein
MEGAVGSTGAIAPFTWQYSPLVSTSVALVIVAPLVGSAIEDAGIDSPLNALHCVAAVGAGVEPPGFSLVGPLPPHPLMQKVKASAHASDLLIIFVS